MATIHQLPPNVVNQIAAGEVIERPASVVKELIENAVDAGAGRVEVRVEQGGTRRVRVSDDGCGIPAGQLPLAVASHATSKIRSAEDLFRVQSMGFRGEALASIAAVSEFHLRSRPPDQPEAAELEIVGGRMGPVTPAAGAPGTVVDVQRLFFNTPVRQKFLRTTQTEMGHVTESLIRIALAWPECHFSLWHEQRAIHDLPPVERRRDRIHALFGTEIAESLIPINSREGDVELQGYVAEPRVSRANNRMQYLFLNRRHIRDRALQHALSEAYRGLLLHGRYPIAFLWLQMPPDSVDVNVHPTKLEVRFQDGGQLYRQLLGTLRSRFLSSDLTSVVSSAASHAGAAPETGRSEEVSQETAPGTGEPRRQDALAFGSAAPPPFRPFPERGSASRAAGDPVPAGPVRDATSPYAGGAAGDQRHPSSPPAPWSPGGVQLHDRYLVTEDERGIVIIDQHALHERVIYEQLREKVLAGELESQKLLVPEPVRLPPEEAAAVLEQAETLAKLGMRVEPFGGDTVLISAYPAMLANLGPAEVLRQVVGHLMEGSRTVDRRDLLDALLHMISCKAAVKAGDRLNASEVHALLEQRHLCQDAHHCPHGRPTSLVFTREELDKRFQRT